MNDEYLKFAFLICIIFLKLYKVGLQTKKESKGLGDDIIQLRTMKLFKLILSGNLRFYFLKHIFMFFKVAFVILASYRVIWETFFGKVVPYFNKFYATKFKMHHYFICHIASSSWYHLLFQRCKKVGHFKDFDSYAEWDGKILEAWAFPYDLL